MLKDTISFIDCQDSGIYKQNHNILEISNIKDKKALGINITAKCFFIKNSLKVMLLQAFFLFNPKSPSNAGASKAIVAGSGTGHDDSAALPCTLAPHRTKEPSWASI